MTGAAVRLLALLTTAILFSAACTGADEGGKPPSEAKPKAQVEAAVRAEVQALADLAGGTVTNWAAKSSRCDIARAGRSWSMGGSAQIPLPSDKQVETVRAIRNRWARANWEFGDDRITPDVSLSDPVTGSVLAAHPTAKFNISVTSGASHDHLVIGFGTGCYQPAKGEDPANG